MYFIMFNQTEEIVCEDIDEVIKKLVKGWKLYGYAVDKRLSNSLLHECKNY